MTRILVIDDEPQVRTMLREILEDEGYEVVVAVNGNEGLKLYRNEPTDLVITDIIMPGKEGLETIKELRKISPDVKIIAISGGGRVVPKDYLQVAQAFGAQRVFNKPVEYNELLSTIAELVK
ncbi:MAG: response regulator [Anaerolineae bacterium]|nr:MAG: response regulator [Anaerolineae bacterium]